MDKLRELEKKIQELVLSYEDSDIDIVFILRDSRSIIIGGNSCICCGKELLEVFIEENDIKHLSEEEVVKH